MSRPESKASARPGSILDGREVPGARPLYEVGPTMKWGDCRPFSPAFGTHLFDAHQAEAEATTRLSAARIVSISAVEPPGIYASQMGAKEAEAYRNRDAAHSLADLIVKEGKLEWRPSTPADASLIRRREMNETSRPRFRDYESEMAQISKTAELVVMTRDDYNRLVASIARLSDIAKGTKNE